MGAQDAELMTLRLSRFRPAEGRGNSQDDGEGWSQGKSCAASLGNHQFTLEAENEVFQERYLQEKE